MHEKNRLVKNLKTKNFPISIDRASIEYQSSQENSNQNFNCIFDQSRNSFDRSKIWKTQFFFFEKQSNFMQKLLKAWYFMNKMHEYEMKYFSKTLVLNPDLPKKRFSINFSLNLKL